MDLPEHLGGHAHMTNVDVGVLRTLADLYKPASFLDIGCGPGGMLDVALALGLAPQGVDGDFTLDYGGREVVLHDFTTGPWAPEEEVDLGWSVEFLEHVEERFLVNVAPAFKACRVVWVTHAVPRQIGWHHVNCQTSDYWRNVFRGWGFAWSRGKTDLLRSRSTMEAKYARRTGLLFERR